MMEGTLAEGFLGGSQEVREGLQGFTSSEEMGADALGATRSAVNSLLKHARAGEMNSAGSATRWRCRM